MKKNKKRPGSKKVHVSKKVSAKGGSASGGKKSTAVSKVPLQLKKPKKSVVANDYFLKPASIVSAIQVPSGKPGSVKKNIENRTHYSDGELFEFKNIITRKLEEAKRDYSLLMGQISHSDEHGTDDTSPTFKMLEDGTDILSKEELSQLANRQQKFIRNLENAMVRIENKTYGICRATGKLIEKERLKAVPHATLSYEAKMQRV